MNEHEETASEFGKGLAYCLGLFLCHAERGGEVGEDVNLWFNAASDHLFELQTDAAPEKLRDRLEKFRENILHWGHGFSAPMPTQGDKKWTIQEAKDLLRLLDQENGVFVERGEYE